MNRDDSVISPSSSPSPSASSSSAEPPWRRPWRLAVKECRESLRDRRTIITLVMMPILLYPLLTIAFQQFLAAGAGGFDPARLQIGCKTEQEILVLKGFLNTALAPDDPSADDSPLASPNAEKLPKFYVNADAERLLLAGIFDVWIQIEPHPSRRGAMHWKLTTVKDSVMGARAADYLEKWITNVNQAILIQNGVTIPALAERSLVSVGGPKSERFSLSALIPLILVLMTITGAVYPAIDLTAGERERGTLELLVAAPTSRLLLLFSKYCAVLIVALLTATVNLVAMGATLMATGLGEALFGAKGISFLTLLQIFGLQALFAAFFSAVLLAITSFARSFKEAQAYLIPIMLVSLSPGFASLLPGVTLGGPLQVVPLLNIVLLARDLLNGQAQGPTVLIVVVTTALYGMAALALAARIFGAEAVVHSDQGGWSDLWRRGDDPQASSSASSSTVAFATATAFPAYLLLGAAVQRFGDWPLMGRLALAGSAQALVFAGVPLLFLKLTGTRIGSGLAMTRRPAGLMIAGALLLGMALWPFGHEIAVTTRQLGIYSFSDEMLKKVQSANDQLRQASPIVLFLLFAVLPAVSEEWFFRGFMFTGLRRSFSARSTILITAAIFGAFHLVTPNAIMVERFLPTALLGIALGWLRSRSGSVWPGMLMHVGHNGLLILLLSFEKELMARGWGVEDASHLPAAWLATAAGVAIAGAALIRLAPAAPSAEDGDEPKPA